MEDGGRRRRTMNLLFNVNPARTLLSHEVMGVGRGAAGGISLRWGEGFKTRFTRIFPRIYRPIPDLRYWPPPP